MNRPNYASHLMLIVIVKYWKEWELIRRVRKITLEYGDNAFVRKKAGNITRTTFMEVRQITNILVSTVASGSNNRIIS